MTDTTEGMPKYVSHKTVHALEIAEVGEANAAGSRFLSFADSAIPDQQVGADMFTRYVPVPGDFYVVYADGYKSFSPRKAFLEGYTRAL
jgi:hypothetical protein